MRVVALPLILAACQPDASTTDTPSGDTDLAVVGDPGVLVGAFQITLVPPDDTVDPPRAGATTVVGKVYDGPLPQSVVWEEEQVDGDCRLVKPRIPFCETPCGGDAVCVEDDTCQPWPVAQTVGTVTVDGLQAVDGGASFTMDPLGTTYQKPAEVDLVWPPLGAGDPVGLTTGTSSFTASFHITGVGIAPLILRTTDWTLDGTAPFPLTWQPGSAASLIEVKLDISHHGGTRGQVLCETADDGELVLPATMVQGLLDLGVSGFPSIVVSRTATGSHTIAAGRVDLVTSSTVERFVDIPGLSSCFSHEDCPEGESCQDDLTCQ